MERLDPVRLLGEALVGRAHALDDRGAKEAVRGEIERGVREEGLVVDRIGHHRKGESQRQGTEQALECQRLPRRRSQ